MSELKNTREKAIALLARREHSVNELFHKLRARNFSVESIEIVLKTLQEKNLLSDTRFVEIYIHHRRQKGFGPLRIQAELQERGIAKELIEDHLNITDNTWLTEVRLVWQKRFKNRAPADYKARMQQMRFLHQRGFTSEQVNSLPFTSD